MSEPWPDDESDYRELADKIIKCFNPPDDDAAEIAIMLKAVEAAAKFIRDETDCECQLDYDPEDMAEACNRCEVLGRRRDVQVER
jgi:hypothetical protein